MFNKFYKHKEKNNPDVNNSITMVKVKIFGNKNTKNYSLDVLLKNENIMDIGEEKEVSRIEKNMVNFDTIYSLFKTSKNIIAIFDIQTL